MKVTNELFNLAMEVSKSSLLPGETRTLHDLACFIEATMEEMMGIESFSFSAERVRQIEQKGLRRGRATLYRDPAAREVLRDGLEVYRRMATSMWDRTVSYLDRWER